MSPLLVQRVMLLCHRKRQTESGEYVLSQMHGPAIFLHVEYVDEDPTTHELVDPYTIYHDTTLQVYNSYFAEAQLQYSESQMGADGMLATLLRTCVKVSPAINTLGTAVSQVVSAARTQSDSALPLSYKPGEWKLTKSPKTLLIEYRQRYFKHDVHFQLMSSSPFLYSVVVRTHLLLVIEKENLH